MIRISVTLCAIARHVDMVELNVKCGNIPSARRDFAIELELYKSWFSGCPQMAESALMQNNRSRYVSSICLVIFKADRPMDDLPAHITIATVD